LGKHCFPIEISISASISVHLSMRLNAPCYRNSRLLNVLNENEIFSARWSADKISTPMIGRCASSKISSALTAIASNCKTAGTTRRNEFTNAPGLQDEYLMDAIGPHMRDRIFLYRERVLLHVVFGGHFSFPLRSASVRCEICLRARSTFCHRRVFFTRGESRSLPSFLFFFFFFSFLFFALFFFLSFFEFSFG